MLRGKEIGFFSYIIYVFSFYCCSWCGPCRQMAPIVKRLAVRFPQVTFYKVNVDIYKKIAEKYKITGIPAFYLFSPAIHAIGLPAQTSDPKIIDSFMGAKNESDFKNWLTANLSKK